MSDCIPVPKDLNGINVSKCPRILMVQMFKDSLQKFGIVAGKMAYFNYVQVGKILHEGKNGFVRKSIFEKRRL